MELSLRMRTARQPAGPARDAPAGAGGRLPDWRTALKRADHACCCPATPAVVVIMPAAARRPEPVELLLCGHHYRVSRDALAVAGAVVFDTSGAPLGPGPFQAAAHASQPASS